MQVTLEAPMHDVKIHLQLCGETHNYIYHCLIPLRNTLECRARWYCADTSSTNKQNKQIYHQLWLRNTLEYRAKCNFVHTKNVIQTALFSNYT